MSTTTNTNVGANPSPLNTLQAALQGKTDLFSLIDGGQGFATMLQQFDADQVGAPTAYVGPKPSRSASDEQTVPAADDAPSSRDAANIPTRTVAPTDQPRIADHKNKIKPDCRADACAETHDQDTVDAAQVVKTDAVPDAAASDVEDAAIISEDISTSGTADGATVTQDSAQIQDPVAPQSQVSMLPLHVVVLQHTQKIVDKEEKNDSAKPVDVMGQEGDGGSETGDNQATGASPVDAAAIRKNQNQAAAADADAMGQDDAASDAAAVITAPTVKHSDAHEAKSAAAGSEGAPLARDGAAAGGSSTQPITNLLAALKSTETPANTAANGNNGAAGAASAKIDAAGLRLFEATGKLTQNYDSATQLTAPKSAKSTVLNALQVIEQVTVKLNQQAKNGLEQMLIQLRPADLGRVDIRLSFQDGAVTALVTADTQTTLDLLAKDSRSLERALQEAGLRADPGSLSFQLRDSGGQAMGQDNRSAGDKGSFALDLPEDVGVEIDDAEEIYVIEPNRVNLRV